MGRVTDADPISGDGAEQSGYAAIRKDENLGLEGRRIMRRGMAILVAVAALVIGASVLVAPSASEAVTITSVTVTVGSTTWCDTTGSCSNKIWNLGGGVNLATGNSLILSQTGATSFNFDTSEGNLPACNVGSPCTTTIVVNGVTVGGGNDVLANGNIDPGTPSHNEAANYAAYGATAAFSVSTGYADNVHTDACADSGAVSPASCFPGTTSRFDNGAGDTLIAGGNTAPGFPNPPSANHCVPTAADCFDAGVVRITALDVPRVPEPSTLLLLGVGIMGLAAWGRSRRA